MWITSEHNFHRLVPPFVLFVSLWLTPLTVHSQERLEFTRLLAHWAEYDHPDYLPFVFEAEPDVVQLGFYGAHFWSLAHTPAYKGYPAHLPVQGHKACGDWFAERNRLLHEKGIKVVGHFNVEFLVGDPDGPNGPTGFFKFYRDHWHEAELGPKPVADPLTMLERGPDGQPISQKGYGIGGMKEYWACLRNPHWQAVMKAWVKRGVERGVDGYIANYFYRHNCLCEHCQGEFRAYLKERHTANELAKLGIADINTHAFKEIVFWHDPALEIKAEGNAVIIADRGDPLRLEMLRWSQVSNKRVFDKVFIHYGRSLKKDLIVAQWNHLGNFQQISGDERCLLPAEQWGKGEDYLWYSTGGAACATDLAAGNLGEGTLQARYICGMFDDKPFTLGKYEHTRIRVTIAELAANGGAPMGFYTRFTEPEARKAIVQYYQFLKRYDEIYRGNQPHAEAVLVYPRQKVAEGGQNSIDAVNIFRAFGKQLLELHVLFDVCSDEAQHKDRREAYPRRFEFGSHIGRIIGDPRKLPAGLLAEAEPEFSKFSQFNAPPTVRISASRPATGDELDIHFVNYNRTEPPKNKDGTPSTGRGIQDEQPIEAPPIPCTVVLPKGFEAAGVSIITPESPDPNHVSYEDIAGNAIFTCPKFLVYAVARIKLKPKGK